MSQSILPVKFAWEVFGIRNGTDNYADFYSMIKSYRGMSNPIEKNPNIGCIVLTNPIFFNEEDWLDVPNNWAKNIVQGKTYSTKDEIGQQYWNLVQARILKYLPQTSASQVNEPSPQYAQYLTNVRIGQGAFRVMVTDAYSRRCAISGEKTLPVLQAAHIKPYAEFWINTVDNGLLLRSDLHKLFDDGYLTITPEYNIEVSRKIKEQFENGRDYYRYHGNQLISLPSGKLDMPKKEYLLWHNENVYEKVSGVSRI